MNSSGPCRDSHTTSFTFSDEAAFPDAGAPPAAGASFLLHDTNARAKAETAATVKSKFLFIQYPPDASGTLPHDRMTYRIKEKSLKAYFYLNTA
jgi:hypothetical protein